MDPAEAGRRTAQVAAVFDQVADTYDQTDVAWFTPIAHAMVAGAQPAPGERVLDIGCGRGAALFPLAEAVGAGGTVTGIDLAPGMIEATAAEVERRGLTNVDLMVMDGSAPVFEPESFDLVTASLVVFFMPDPPAALARWRELVRHSGRLALSSFGDRTPVWESIDDVFRPYLPAQMLDARTSGASGPFTSDAGVERLVSQAGFTKVRTSTTDIDVVLTGVDHWYRWSRSHGQRAMWNLVPADRHADVLAEVAELVAPIQEPDATIRLRQQARFTYGERDGT